MSEQDEVVQPMEAVPEPEDLVEAAAPVEDLAAAVEPEKVPVTEAGEEAARLDLNTATERELQELPGIGRALAARIVSYRAEVRPFQNPADVTAVPGISEAMYARIADRVIAGSPQVPPAADEWLEAEPEVEPFEAQGPEAVPVGAEPPLVKVVPGAAGWGRVLFVGLLSAIAGALLALAFLLAYNGTLDFQTTALRAAQNEVSRLEGELTVLGTRLDQVEGRLGAIQELDARLSDTQASVQQLAGDLEATQASLASMAEALRAVRQEYTNLREDVDGLAGQVSMLGNRVGTVEEQVAGLSQEIETMGESVQRFDAFLNALRDILNGSAGASRPAPTMEGTPTLRPMMTVSPLMTPSPPAP